MMLTATSFSCSRSFARAAATRPVGTATMPSPAMSTKIVKTRPPSVMGDGIVITKGAHSDEGPPKAVKSGGIDQGLSLISKRVDAHSGEV